MKKLLSLSFLLFVLNLSFSQESLFVSLDKPFYVLGEQIWFKTNLHRTAPDNLPSQKLRVDLLSPQGEIIAKHHLKIEAGAAFGDFQIPLDWEEGWYTLRAYTVWSPKPQIRDIVTIQFPIYDDFGERDLETTSLEGSSKINESSSIFNIKVENSTIQRRGQQVFTISSREILNGNVCVSVIPKEMFSEKSNFTLATASKENESTFDNQQPEKATMNYSKINKDPNQGNLLGLAVYFPENNEFQYVSANKSGIFSFENNLYEEQKVQVFGLFFENSLNYKLIKAEDLNLAQSIDFKANNAPLPTSPYLLQYLEQSQKRKKYKAIFDLPDPVFTSAQFENQSSLKPDATYILDEYAAMTSSVEFLREVIPYVKIKEKNGRQEVSMFNELKEYYKSTPIFMIDGWISNNHEEILAIPVEEIERIDVFRTTETLKPQFGGVGNYGVIAFYSKKGNLDKDLSSKAQTLQAQGLCQNKEFSTPQSENTHLPDFRPLIYWNPIVSLNNGQAKLEFTHSDDLGDFVILVRGLGKDGKIETSFLEYRVY